MINTFKSTSMVADGDFESANKLDLFFNKCLGMQRTAEDLQLEPQYNKGSSAVENLMLGPCAQEGVLQCPIRLSASCTHFPQHEGLREAGLGFCSLVKPALDSPEIRR